METILENHFSNNTNSFIYSLYKNDFHKNKFDCLKKVFNCIQTPSVIETYFEVFSKIQQFLHGMRRFIHIIKLKRAKIYNTEDLHMNPIESGQKNTITLLQNNTKYVFHIRELLSFLKTSLNYSSNFFIEPIVLKNPYTNIPFDKSSLYNIYFAISFSTFILPVALQQFFLCDFHISRLAIENEELLTLTSLNVYVDNICKFNVHNCVEVMFKTYNIPINIDKTFSNNTLYSIMKPFLNIYYKSLYSTRESIRNTSSRNLLRKLQNFYNLNPTFGRKKVKFETNNNPFEKKKKLSYHFSEVNLFDDDHSFKTISDKFLKDHLCKKEFNNRDVPLFIRRQIFRRHIQPESDPEPEPEYESDDDIINETDDDTINETDDDTIINEQDEGIIDEDFSDYDST